MCIAQVGIAQVGIAQAGTAQGGRAQIGTAHVGSAQVGIAQIGIAQVSRAEVSTAQVGQAAAAGIIIWPPDCHPTDRLAAPAAEFSQVGTAQIGTAAANDRDSLECVFSSCSLLVYAALYQASFCYELHERCLAAWVQPSQRR